MKKNLLHGMILLASREVRIAVVAIIVAFAVLTVAASRCHADVTYIYQGGNYLGDPNFSQSYQDYYGGLTPGGELNVTFTTPWPLNPSAKVNCYENYHEYAGEVLNGPFPFTWNSASPSASIPAYSSSPSTGTPWSYFQLTTDSHGNIVTWMFYAGVVFDANYVNEEYWQNYDYVGSIDGLIGEVPNDYYYQFAGGGITAALFAPAGSWLPVNPDTTATLVGTVAPDGDYAGPVTVTLSVAPAGSPVAATYYILDGDAQKTYTGPFTVSANYDHQLYYWSADTAGDVEPQQSLNFFITPELAPISVSPNSLAGGTGATVTIPLTNPAPAGGAVVTLSTSDAAAAKFTTTSVSIPEGATSTTVPLSTFSVAANTSVTITAKYIVSHTCHIDVLGPKVASVKVLPTKVVGGASATGTVALTSVAAVDTTVNVTSSSGSASISGPVIVPAGSSETTFTVDTNPVAANTPATITASLDGTSASSSITVKSPVLGSIELAPGTVHSGGGTTATVTLESPAPAGGIAVDLSYPSNGSLLSSAPTTVSVAGGATTGTATITVGTIAAASTVIVEASLGTTDHSATLNVKP